MTEPQKMGVEEVMALVTDYFNETCRDMAIGGGDPEQCFDRIKFAVKAIIADRDALAQRVTELEGAVRENWRTTPDDIDYFCAFCNAHTPYDWSTDSIEHAHGCIVRTINPQP